MSLLIDNVDPQSHNYPQKYHGNLLVITYLPSAFPEMANVARSLKLLAEESRRLLSRSAREHELQTSAMASLAKAGKIVVVHNYHGKPMESGLYIILY